MDGDMEKLASIFETGSVMYLKHPALPEPALCLVEKAEGQDLFFKLQDIFIEKSFLKGDQVSCHALRGQEEYVGLGEIVEIQLREPNLVQVTLKKVNKYKNHRAFLRYNVDFQANITLHDGRKTYGIIKNMSILGAALVSREELEKDSLVFVQVYTFVSMEFMEFKAKIVRTFPGEGFHEYGLEIVEIGEESKDMLEKVLFYLNTNEEIFIENLKNL